MKRLLQIVCLVASLGAALLAAADAPPGRYTISNGTVYDTRTKLTWRQPAAGGPLTLSQGGTFCVNLGGGWRLPMVSELLSLVDRMKATGPAIDTTAFPDGMATLYWSTTSSATSWAWTVDFTDGRMLSQDVTVGHQVRCVR